MENDKKQQLRFAICDDRFKDRERLERQILDYCRSKKLEAVVDTFEDGESLIAAMKLSSFSVIFLDIFMNEMTGIETARKFRAFSKCPLVFVTTSPDYALEGFELNAIHYLVKPCTTEAVGLALERCVEVVEAFAKTLEIKTGRETLEIKQSDITYLEVFGNKTVVHTTADEPIITYTPLGTLYNDLDNSLFIYPQRSYVVNLAYINEIPTSLLTLKNGVEISISRKERTAIKQQYLKYLMDIAQKGVI